MAEDKKGFILYADQKELFEQLPNEKAGELIKHIFAYVNDENPVTDDLVINLSFTPIKQQFKRDLKKWEKTREGRSKAGKASAEARKNKKQQTLTKSTNVENVQQTSTNPTVNDNVNVNVTVNDNVKEIESNKNAFSPKDFLIWFNEKRTEYLERPSNCNLLTNENKIHLEILSKNYTGVDFNKAFHNMCNNKWANESNLILPKHFLKPTNFDMYLQMEVIPKISKKQKVQRGWVK